MRCLVSLVGISALVCACGIRTNFTPLNPPPRELQVRRAADVILLDAVPQQPHVEIGAIEAQRMSNSDADKKELYAALRKVGAQHGCDAVRIVGRSEGRYGFQAACIVFKEPVAPKPSGVPATTSPPPVGLSSPPAADPSPAPTAPADAGSDPVRR